MSATLETKGATGDGRPGRAAEPAEGAGVGLALRATGTVVAPASLVSGLLYYFGWVRTNAQARYFGIDPSVLDFSTKDYLLRSISPTFWPLVLLLVTVLLGAFGHWRACSWLESPSRHAALRRAAFVAGAAGLTLLGFGLLATNWRAATGHHLLLTPVAFALGVPLTGYAVYLFARLRPGGTTPGSTWPYLPAVAVTIATSLFVLSLFWAMGDYAHMKGRRLARQIESNLALLTNVVLYSDHSLGIEAPGVAESETPAGEGALRFRYSGLKLLVRSQDRYFLLPARYEGTAIVLTEEEGMRLEFVRGG